MLPHNRHVDDLLDDALLQTLLRDGLRNFHGFLQDLRNGHVYDLLRCALLQTLCGNDLHDFDTWLTNLRYGDVDGLLDVALRNTLLWNKLDLFNDIFEVHGLLHGAMLHPFLWNELHESSDFLHRMGHRDVEDFFHDVLVDSLLSNDLDRFTGLCAHTQSLRQCAVEHAPEFALAVPTDSPLHRMQRAPFCASSGSDWKTEILNALSRRMGFIDAKCESGPPSGSPNRHFVWSFPVR